MIDLRRTWPVLFGALLAGACGDGGDAPASPPAASPGAPPPDAAAPGPSGAAKALATERLFVTAPENLAIDPELRGEYLGGGFFQGTSTVRTTVWRSRSPLGPDTPSVRLAARRAGVHTATWRFLGGSPPLVASLWIAEAEERAAPVVTLATLDAEGIPRETPLGLDADARAVVDGVAWRRYVGALRGAAFGWGDVVATLDAASADTVWYVAGVEVRPGDADEARVTGARGEPLGDATRAVLAAAHARRRLTDPVRPRTPVVTPRPSPLRPR